MDIFRSVTQTVLGSQPSGNQPTGAETVERLLDRVQSSTLLEDRRDGCRALKALSKKYRLIVGAHGMDTLIQVLESDRSDHEIVNYALESLVNITSSDVFTEEGEEENSTELECAKIGEQFTEIFIKRVENIALILSLMDEFDFKVRFPAMKLLNNLLQNRHKELQEAILVTPSGVSKLMDMLSDSREIIRNDTLLLLTQLTKGNTNLQKIVVFENALDLLFEIVKEEGHAEGGVVVEDCLILMLNLVKNNPSNQMLFKEGNYIQKMSDFFSFPLDNDEAGWSAQKVANVHYILKLLRTLVSPQNSAQVVSSCQRKMKSCDLLARLCALLMAVGVPADILSDTIAAVSEVIRGSQENQEYFSGVTAPSTPPRPAIVVLLMSMVNEKQLFSLRCAVLYCFECYLYRNPASQAQVVQTLLPQTAEANQVTAGQLLCGGLFSQDPISNWFSAVALSHALLDNNTEKEQLLRVQLATGTGSPPVSLLQQCASRLQGGSKLLTRLGILQLLCTWLAQCPAAVSHLLNIPAVIPHLTANLSANEHDDLEVACQGLCAFLLGLCSYFNDDSVPAFNRVALSHLVANRVGADNFKNKVENILRTEAYSKAAKSPQMAAKQPAEVVFDHEFTKMFKSLEAGIVRSVLPHVNGSGEEIPSAEVIRYKDIIRDQDQEMTRLRQALAEVEGQVKALKEGQQQQQQQVTIGLDPAPEAGPPNGAPSDQVSLLQQQLTEMTYARDYYYYQMAEKEALLQGQNPGSVQSPNPEMENLRKQLDDLQLVLYRKDEEIQRIREAPPESSPGVQTPLGQTPGVQTPLGQTPGVQTPGAQIPGVHSPSTDDSSIIKRLEESKSCLESSVARMESEKREAEASLSATVAKLRESEERVASLLEDDANKKVAALEAELSSLQGEQEDVLILLTDQEAKITKMKRSLRKYGEVFSDDDDDDDDDEDPDVGDLDMDFEVSSDDEDDLT